MATDGDKMAAAVMTAAFLRPFESSGEAGDLGRVQTRAVTNAVSIYKEILAAIQKLEPPA